MDRGLASPIRVTEPLTEVISRLNWRIFVGTVVAGDQSLIVRLDEESQGLACAGVSSRGQGNSVELCSKDHAKYIILNIKTKIIYTLQLSICIGISY